MTPKKTILLVGHLWPYSYGGHRMISLCRELSKTYNVVCLTRPLYNDVNSLCDESFLVYQTTGPTDIYDPLRSFLRFCRNILGQKNKAFIDKPNSGVINQLAGKDNKKSYIKFLIKYLLSTHRLLESFFAFPDTEWPWLFSALPLAFELVKKHEPDIIITNYPFSSHIIGSRIKHHFPNIKWIVDFVDLWSLNHFYPYCRLRYFWESRFEKSVLRKADKVITCTQSLARAQADFLGREVSTIYHSASLASHLSILSNLQDKRQETRFFIIRYFGTFYSNFQRKNFEIFKNSLLRAVSILQSEGIEHKPILIQFVGTKSGYLSCMESLNCKEIIFEFLPRVDHSKALELMHLSDCLLLPFYESDDSTIDIVGSKFIDYVCSDTATLLVGNHPDEFTKLAGDGYPNCDSVDNCTNQIIGLLSAYSENRDLFILSNYIDKTVFDLSLLSNRFLDGI